MDNFHICVYTDLIATSYKHLIVCVCISMQYKRTPLHMAVYKDKLLAKSLKADTSPSTVSLTNALTFLAYYTIVSCAINLIYWVANYTSINL